MTDQKLPRKETAPIASIFPQFDFRNELAEVEFRRSGYGFEICGGEVSHDEIPVGFPSYLAVTELSHTHAE